MFPGTAPPVQASSIPSRPKRRSTACACSDVTWAGAPSSLQPGLDWAIENNMQVVNLSLSTSLEEFFGLFHDLADQAYFKNMNLVWQ